MMMFGHVNTVISPLSLSLSLSPQHEINKSNQKSEEGENIQTDSTYYITTTLLTTETGNCHHVFWHHLIFTFEKVWIFPLYCGKHSKYWGQTEIIPPADSVLTRQMAIRCSFVLIKRDTSSQSYSSLVSQSITKLRLGPGTRDPSVAIHCI